VHFAPLEDVFSSASEDKAARLKEVLSMIDDETGRDDFVCCLRMLSLQKVLPFSAWPCFQVPFWYGTCNFMLIFCSDCTGKWLHQDHARDMRFWNSMPCAIYHREGILLIWWCLIVVEKIMRECWVHDWITNCSQGQGHSLPADVQYVDTRWEVPVVLPLHDCLAQELSLLCELDR